MFESAICLFPAVSDGNFVQGALEVGGGGPSTSEELFPVRISLWPFCGNRREISDKEILWSWFPRQGQTSQLPNLFISVKLHYLAAAALVSLKLVWAYGFIHSSVPMGSRDIYIYCAYKIFILVTYYTIYHIVPGVYHEIDNILPRIVHPIYSAIGCCVKAWRFEDRC